MNFYPRPPRGGRRAHAPFQKKSTLFLSTPSARRATVAAPAGRLYYLISIHALREEGDALPPKGRVRRISSFPPLREGGDALTLKARLLKIISIHALREEGDARAGQRQRAKKISIHALREEGDDYFGISVDELMDFYPRPPRGGRLTACNLACVLG